MPKNPQYNAEVDLTLEKLNSQRINSLDSDIKDIRRDLSTLMRELPNIIQGAVTQAVASDGKVSHSTSSNGNGGGGLNLVLVCTLIFSLAGFIGQQVFFNGQQTEKTSTNLKTHIEHANAKDVELAVLQNEVKWVKFVAGIDETEGKLKKVGQ